MQSPTRYRNEYSTKHRVFNRDQIAASSVGFWVFFFKSSHGKSYSLFHLCEKGQDVLLVISSCVKNKMLPKPTLNILPQEKQVKLL